MDSNKIERNESFSWLIFVGCENENEERQREDNKRNNIRA